MDPISQAGLGAGLAQAFANDKTKLNSALVIGALAGMAPDLDIFIRSSEDPILFLEFHRQFTHSLIFIPFGSLICALVFYAFIRIKRFKINLSFAQVYLFSFLGYATHGLLDACTSYGTQLFWPFSTERFAWNTVSIIDPFFTFPLLIFILLASVTKKVRYARFGFVYAVLFLSLGLVQKQRAQDAVYELAQQRGHQVERVQVKPSFGNRHLWKVIYEYENRYYVDAVKILWSTEYFEGASIKKLDVKRDFPWLPEDSQQAKDIERFRWFSDDFLAVSTHDPNLIMDIRYSFLPNRINAMWGVEVDKYYVDHGLNDQHIGYVMRQNLNKDTLPTFMDMLF